MSIKIFFLDTEGMADKRNTEQDESCLCRQANFINITKFFNKVLKW